MVVLLNTPAKLHIYINIRKIFTFFITPYHIFLYLSLIFFFYFLIF